MRVGFMTGSSARPLLTPEEIAVRAGEQAPFLRFAERSTLFGEREMRLRQLASGHAMGDYLRFIADVAQVQAELLAGLASTSTSKSASTASATSASISISISIPATLPTPLQIDAAAREGRPLLDATAWPRDASWLAVQRRLLERLDERLAPGPARDVVRTLAAAGDALFEAQADRLLAGVMLGLDLGTAPLIGAGLQVWFTHLVLATADANADAREAPFGRVDEHTLCPCCGSRPSVGIVRIGAAEAGFRYLACSLCSTQWHMVRIKCSHCLSTKGVGYQSLRSLAAGDEAGGEAGDAGMGSVEGADAASRAIQAECCSECGHYLKMLHMERDPHVEPTADDLASLTLDLLVSEGGFARHGVDLMLLFGDPDAAPPDPP